MEDIRSRAAEIAAHRPGQPWHADFIYALISRLGDHDVRQLPSVQAFLSAWDEVYTAGRK